MCFAAVSANYNSVCFATVSASYNTGGEKSSPFFRKTIIKFYDIDENYIDYLKNLYDGVPYRYFIYNSSKLSDVRQFATSDNIEIMIINISEIPNIFKWDCIFFGRTNRERNITFFQ